MSEVDEKQKDTYKIQPLTSLMYKQYTFGCSIDSSYHYVHCLWVLYQLSWPPVLHHAHLQCQVRRNGGQRLTDNVLALLKNELNCCRNQRRRV